MPDAAAFQLARRYVYDEDMFGLGRAERGTRRALIACWPNPARVTDLLEWTYPRVEKPKNWHRTS
jgi:hypothetical protein